MPKVTQVIPKRYDLVLWLILNSRVLPQDKRFRSAISQQRAS
jgi:hypothetical protein